MAGSGLDGCGFSGGRETRQAGSGTGLQACFQTAGIKNDVARVPVGRAV